MRTNYFGIILLIFLILFLELNISGKIELFNTRPDLLFIMVIFLSLHLDLAQSGIFGFVAGVLRDSTSISISGLYVILFLFCAIIVSFVGKMFYKEDSITQTWLTFIFCFMLNLFYGCILILKSEDLGIDFVLVRTLLISFYTALISPIIFFLLTRNFFKEFLGIKEVYKFR